jgi:4-amino-4-deoxy-L-arabinose transferase-like glycosyltransferase
VVLFPATLFLLFIFDKEQIKKIKQNPFLVFLVLTFLVNFIIYLISPGAKIRYTYMFFPMIIFVLTYPFYNQLADNSKKTRIFYGILRTLMLLLSIILMVTPFVKINANPMFLNFSMPVFGIVILLILYLNLKKTSYVKCLTVVLFFVVCRLAYDHIIMPYKAELPKNAQNKMYADALYNIIGNEKNLYVLSTDDVNSTDKINKYHDIPFKFYETATYLEMYREKIIYKKPMIDAKGFYIINLEQHKNFKPLYTFQINEFKLGWIQVINATSPLLLIALTNTSFGDK